MGATTVEYAEPRLPGFGVKVWRSGFASVVARQFLRAPRERNSDVLRTRRCSHLGTVAVFDRIPIDQKERSFAQGLLDDASVSYGAITACLLPVLYALLDTCAYLLRTFEKQISARTFTPSIVNSVRFLIAGIGGGVVEPRQLHHHVRNLHTVSSKRVLGRIRCQCLFLVLESLLQTFTRNKSQASSPPLISSPGPKA